jgi:hypothetical protein
MSELEGVGDDDLGVKCEMLPSVDKDLERGKA